MQCPSTKSVLIFTALMFVGIELISTAPRFPMSTAGKSVNETSLEEFLYQCLVSFINVMLTGNPQLGIPVLDPLESSKNLNFLVDDPIVRADVNATDIASVGLSSLVITSVDVSLLQSRWNLSLHFPQLKISGSYLLDGVVNLFHPVYGDGPFVMYLYDVTTSGTTILSLNDSQLTMSPFTMGTMYYSAMSAEFLNFIGLFLDESTKSQAKMVVAKELYYQAEMRIREALATSLYEYFNAELVHYNVTKYPLKLSGK